jgi:hypothetical protein
MCVVWGKWEQGRGGDLGVKGSDRKRNHMKRAFTISTLPNILRMMK